MNHPDNLGTNTGFLQRPVFGWWRWLAAALPSFGYFAVVILVFNVIQPDLDEHIIISEGMWENGKVPAHPMFYACIQLLSFFTNDFQLELIAAFIIFGTAQTMKIITAGNLIETISGKKLSQASFIAVFISCWMITPGIFETQYIVNQMVPNFFHNGTLLMSIPFYLWMIRRMYMLVEQDDSGSIRQILLAGIFAGLCKPSFMFCIIPVFPLYVYLRKGISYPLLQALQISLTFSFLIIGQSLYLRINPPNYISSFKIKFMPFYQYGSFSQHVKVLLYSLSVPALFFLLGRKELKKAFLYFLMACHFLGVLIAFTLVDTINGIKFSNMTWQTSITLLLLLITTSGLFFQSDRVRFSAKLFMFCVLFACLAYTGWYSFQVVVYRNFFL
jgi:hypothetical protein